MPKIMKFDGDLMKLWSKTSWVIFWPTLYNVYYIKKQPHFGDTTDNVCEWNAVFNG